MIREALVIGAMVAHAGLSWSMQSRAPAFPPAEDVARAIVRAARSREPRWRYQAPFSARFAAALVPWIPTSIEDRALARLFELDRLVPR